MTQTAQHTPGPWRVFDVFADVEIVTDHSTAHETESLVQFKGQRNAQANARLMAAAPEGLDAAQYAVGYLRLFAEQEGLDEMLQNCICNAALMLERFITKATDE